MVKRFTKIRARLGHEGVAAIRGWKRVAAINQRAAGACGSGQSPVGAECFGIVAAIHTRRGMRGIERLIASELRIDARRISQQRIPRKGLCWQQIGTQHVGVVVEIEPAEVVLAKPPLAATEAGVLHPHAAAQLETRGIFGAPDRVVHGPHGRVRHVLRLTAERAEVGGDHFFHIRHAIAVRVFAEEQLRRHGDQSATIHRHHRTRHDDFVEKRRRLVHAPIAIRVFEQRNTSRGLLFRAASQIVHVATHLADIEPPLIIKTHRHRRFDHRLRCHELDAEALFHLKRLHRLLRRKRLRRRQFELQLDLLRAGVFGMHCERLRRE